MIATPALAWVLTAVFVLTGGYALLRWAATMTGPLQRGRRTTELAHLLMSVSMLVMTWTWFGSAGLAVQVALFALFTAYFAARAVAGRRGLVHACPGGTAHMLAAAAMVWMLVSMPLIMATPVAAPGAEGGHAGHAGNDMSGMGGPGGGPSAWAVGVTLALCVALVVAAGFWAIRALRREPGPVSPDAGTSAADGPTRRGADPTVVDREGSDRDGATASAAQDVAGLYGAATTVGRHAPDGATAGAVATLERTAPRMAAAGAFTPVAPRSDAACHAAMSIGMAAMLLAMVAGW